MQERFRCIVAEYRAQVAVVDAVCDVIASRTDATCLRMPADQARHERADLLLICAGAVGDALMPLVAECRGFDAQRAVVVVADLDCEGGLSALIRLGITDFVRLPLSRAELAVRIDRLLGEAAHAADARPMAPWLGCADPLLFSVNPRFNAQLARLPRLAGSGCDLLVRGESGTGRRPALRSFAALAGGAQPIEIDAGPGGPTEAEAAWQALERARALRAAHQGIAAVTLLTHDLDRLPHDVQRRLAALLASRRIEPERAFRWGGSMSAAEGIDVLAPELAAELPRQQLRMPPLRERREDLLPLVQILLRRECAARARQVPALTPAAARLLMAHGWPGNVREMQEVISRTLDSARVAVVAARELAQHLAADVPLPLTFERSLAEVKAHLVVSFERGFLEQLLAVCHGNIAQAARLSRKNRRALFELIRKHGIDVDRFRPGPAPDKLEETRAVYGAGAA